MLLGQNVGVFYKGHKSDEPIYESLLVWDKYACMDRGARKSYLLLVIIIWPIFYQLVISSDVELPEYFPEGGRWYLPNWGEWYPLFVHSCFPKCRKWL